MSSLLFVRADWDPDASVWGSMSDDVPGLTGEAESIESLIGKRRLMIPELLDANGTPGDEVPFEHLSKRF